MERWSELYGYQWNWRTAGTVTPSLLLLHISGFQVCYSQTLYRNTDGRWSDGRIASRRRVSTSAKNPKGSSASMAPPIFFQRDSPSRVPHGPLVYSRMCMLHTSSVFFPFSDWFLGCEALLRRFSMLAIERTSIFYTGVLKKFWKKIFFQFFYIPKI